MDGAHGAAWTGEAGLPLEVDSAIELVIAHAVKAGVFRAAARLNPKTAHVWNDFAEEQTQRVGALLGEVLVRLGLNEPGPWPL